MTLALSSIAGGLVLLVVSAEVLVQGAASVARQIGLSSLVIGLTVVSVGTSLPELVVSVEAAVTGSGGLALGNVIGSNIANIALILGVVALISPIAVQAQVVRLDAPLLVVASIGFIALIWDGGLGRVDGAILTLGILGYVSYTVSLARRAESDIRDPATTVFQTPDSLLLNGVLIAIGIVGLVGGAHVLVTGAVSIAAALGVSPVVIGLSVVAVGTSLPELATSLVAAWRGQGDIAVGNALGSSIFNLLGILGVTGLVHPLSTASLGWVELSIMLGLSILIVPLLRSSSTLGRVEGAALVLCYVGYMGYLFMA
ncbi:MAG: calcium/sodium antiporter [Salinivenus sp.]